MADLALALSHLSRRFAGDRILGRVRNAMGRDLRAPSALGVDLHLATEPTGNSRR